MCVHFQHYWINFNQSRAKLLNNLHRDGERAQDRISSLQAFNQTTRYKSIDGLAPRI